MFSGALASRDFRLYVFCNFLTLNGVWIQRVCLGWLAWDMTGSVGWTGVIGFLLFGPTMIGAPIFGVLADRVNLPRAMMGLQALRALWSVVLAALLVADALTIWRLAAVTLLVGVTASAHHPARMSLAPLLVPKEKVAQAIPITAMNFNLCRMIGPAIGGLIIARYGVETAVGVSATLTVPIIIALSTFRPRDIHNGGPAPARRRFLTALSDGARHALAQPAIIRAFAITLASALTGRAATELLPVIADGVFQRGAAGLGQLTSAAGAGAICAMLMLTRLRDAPSRLPALTLVMAFAAFALTAALGVSPNWWLSIALVGALGFVSSTVGVGSQTMIQITVDESYRGRVMSLWSVVGIGGAAVGAVVLGAFADLVGIGWAFFSVSAVCAATLAYLSSRSLKSWA